MRLPVGEQRCLPERRRGILPPGVANKTWFDEDHAWAYGMSVYIPNLANAANTAATEMKNAKILQPLQSGETGGFTDKGEKGIQRPGKDVKPGPSGKIEPE